MSTWNYRIFRHKGKEEDETYYAVHETFYDEDKKAWGWTQDLHGTNFISETPEGLIKVIEKMVLKDLKKFKDDILDYDSKPEGRLVELDDETKSSYSVEELIKDLNDTTTQ